jgi:Ca-activated chloride channel homolog
MFRRSLHLVALILAALAPQTTAHAQGILININSNDRVLLPRPIIIDRMSLPRPVPQSTYKIKELTVNTKLVDQIARTQVSQSFVNTGSIQMEVCFVFPLPYDGAIDQLTLLVDGKEYPAQLLEAGEARRVYESIMRKNQDPALLEWIGTGMFKTSVFPVPPGAERKVTLRYSQLCRKDQGLTDFLFPLSTAKYTSHPVEKLEIQLSIETSVDIKNVYSPTHAVEIKRPDNKHATVTFTAKDQVPGSDFRLLYDVGQGEVGTSVLSYRRDGQQDGYFLLLASPQIKAADDDRPKKTVVFAVDRSGSMSGDKFNQAKGALKFVLNNLRAGDLFNIVAFDSQVESFRPELQKFDEETRKSALGFVESLYAGGSTNIDGALRTSLAQLKDSSRPNFVIFLTDGLPTDGEKNEGKIVAGAKAENAVRARVFTFGLGYDVNSRLLDKLARVNYGQSEYVRPNEDIEARVSSLYARIGSPVMTDLSIKFDVEGQTATDGKAVNRTYPAETHDLFAGEQLVLVGRYSKPGAAKVVVSGKVGNRDQRFDFPATLVEKSNDETNAFIEKLWAVRRVGEIIDELDLKGKNDELVKELVQLSTTHGILTPYTAFLADDQTDRHDLARNAMQTRDNLQLLEASDGRAGFGQRQAKGRLQKADRFAGQAPGAPKGGYGGFYAEQDLPAAAAAEPATNGSSHTGRAPIAGKPAQLGSGVAGGGQRPNRPADGAAAVQHVGRKTFYRQHDRWVDGDLTKEQEQNAVQVERFSAEYFELIAKHGAETAKYLNFDEPVTVEIEGRAYAF